MDEIILGLIQGLTEWLPVSSSGHLVIYQQLFNTGTPVVVDVMLHVATLLVILLVFWKDIIEMLAAVVTLDFRSKYGKLAILIVIGSIPTAIIGLVFHDVFIGLYSNLTYVGIALMINGTILFSTKFFKGNGKIRVLDSMIIGIAQGIAIIPGISRSGITISTGLFRGVDRKAAAAFSFLLAVPAIAGAAILESRNLTADIDYLALGSAMIVAVIIGYLSLRLVLKIVLRKKLHYFSYYCWIVGAIILVAQAIR